ncbi:MAG: bacterial transcriptional activator domain-containing protein [Pseudomonadota bacterium]
MSIGIAEFDDWVTSYRAGIVDDAIRVLSGQLAVKRGKLATAAELIPLCELLARIEPADAAANETLIEIYGEQGNRSALNRQIESYSRALDELDIALPTMLRREVKPVPAMPLARPAGAGQDEQHDHRPSVALVGPGNADDHGSPLRFAYAELLSQITRFRRIRCVETTPCCDRGQHPASGSNAYDYRMILWHEPAGRCIFLKCINTRSVGTIAVRKLPYSAFEEPKDAAETIAPAVNDLIEAIASGEAGSQSSPYARWLQAYRHICAFTPRSDNHANAILRGLMHDQDGQRLSVVYSSIGHIAIRRRYREPDGILSADTAAHAQAAVDHALALDPTEPYNHITRGWLMLLTTTSQLGLGCFEDALSLNPHCAETIIGAAAAHAFCGDMETAEQLSRRAGAIVGRRSQPYFQGLLAAVRYHSDDPMGTLNHLHRGPRNMLMAMYSVCANHDLGLYDEAASAYQQMEMRQLETMGTRPFDDRELDQWIRNAGMARNAGIQNRMVDTVLRYRRITSAGELPTNAASIAVGQFGQPDLGRERT